MTEVRERNHKREVCPVQDTTPGRTHIDDMLSDIQPDVPTLRRISLLVMRARDDETEDEIHDGLEKITSVIERMKRSVALGTPFSPADRRALRALVRGLPKSCIQPHCAKEIVRWCAIDELQDLVMKM